MDGTKEPTKSDSQGETSNTAVIAPEEESTDSENDPFPGSSSLHRKMSTSKDVKNTVSLKEGYLMKQTSSFQRWHRRYFRVKGRVLYYAKHDKAEIFDEIPLTEVTLAENTSKNFAHTFQVITPFRTLVLAAENRASMAEWMSTIQSASSSSFHEGGDHANALSRTGAHIWFSTTHAVPTYCNVCREQLCGMMSSGLSCEVCKFKSHKHCASKAVNNCKWTTLASMGKENLQENEGSLIFPHQWLEGNLPVAARCAVCDKICGSVLKLQDWRCLWCRACVHSACRYSIKKKCSLSRISVVPPTALHTVGNDEAWEPSPLQGCSPLLVFVNSKSGDHQGLKFLRRFKQLLNPAQVFDLVNGGPRPGLQLFRHFEPFRILVCGGDGSVGWVMCEIDSLDMHRQVQVGVLPLGTGNDLARVLGWGASCDDEAHLPHLLDKYERATTKMLDRWSIMTYERGCVIKPPIVEHPRHEEKPEISHYEDSVVCHLQNILQSSQHQTVIASAKVLCETVRDMIGKVGSSADDEEINMKCANLSQKLNSLLLTLNEESECNISTEKEGGDEMLEVDSMAEHEYQDLHESLSEEVSSGVPLVAKVKPTKFRQKEILMSRANSLKKAVRQIIEHAEKTIDEQSSSPPVMVVRPLTLEVQQQEESEMTLAPDKTFSEFSKDDTEDPVDSLSLDPHVALPVPIPFTDQNQQNASTILDKLASSNDVSAIDKVQSDQEEVDEKEYFPKIEVQSPSTSSNDKSPQGSEHKEGMYDDQQHLSERNTAAVLDISKQQGAYDNLNVPGDLSYFYRGASPRASRRVSMGSLLKPLEVEIPNSPASRKNSGSHCGAPGELSDYWGLSHSPFSASSTCASSITSSPNKCADSSAGKKKTMPVINPLVMHPSWPSVSAGGVIGKVLMANADAMCAVASPLMDPEASEELLMQGFKERAVMNNYFGIGLDAKITLDFHLKREEHPEKCRSRAKNFMWYGVLGSKEMLQRTCRNLDQRVKLECDGVRIPLPRLQGIVICNIPSFMGGTNFWGMWKEDGFLHSSFDDGIIEVMAVFHTVQMATSRVVNFYQHRIAQCTRVTITILGDEPIPVQVDGEAWLQPPGVIQLVLKNRMPVLCRNRKLESNLKTWEEKLKAMSAASSSLESEENPKPEKKRNSRGSIFGMRFNRKESKRDESTTDSNWDGFSDEVGSSEAKGVEHWTASEVSEWLENLHLGEYKSSFVRHDIRGSELLCLHRRDLKELGVTKIGHIKRILQAVENLQKDAKYPHT